MKKSCCRYRPSLAGLISGLFVAVSANTAALVASEPVPYFSITWSATATGVSDTTDDTGTRTVEQRRVVMTGSAIMRLYADGSLDGSFDDYPFELSVTDEDDIVETTPCGGDGGFRRSHSFFHITDPNRYTLLPGPHHDIVIQEPLQRPDGSWYLLDPFNGFYVNRLFTYRFDYDLTDCNGDANADTNTGLSALYLVLGEPANTIEGDAAGNVFTIDVQRPAEFYPWITVHWTVTARRLLGRDLTVERLEVTQGLQDGANSIPLVEDRRTVVRAYLGVGKDQVPVPGVTGKLTGYSGNTVLGSVRPFNRGRRITAPVSPDWHQIDHTLNFEVPLEWTEQPSLRLEVEVNDDRSVTEIDYTNNKLSDSVNTISCYGISIAYLPVHYTPPGGYSPADPSANIALGQEFMRKIYPIPSKELKYFHWDTLNFTRSLGTEEGGYELLALLLMLGDVSNEPHDRIFGWTPSLAYPDNGFGQTSGVAAFGNDTESPNQWRRTFAHEIGHNEGLRHTDQTTNGRHWFDVYDYTIKPANSDGELLDVMVPARTEPEAWISPESYFKLMTEMCNLGGGQTPKTSAQAAATGDNLLVTGKIVNGTTPTGTIEPLYRTNTAPVRTPPPPQAGPGYCINLKNGNNELLSQTCFDVSFDGDGHPASAMPFGMVVPYPVGLNRVELTRGTTTLLSSRVASANPPTVTVTFPNAPGLILSGVQTVTWTGSDPDGDPLTYNMLYSRNNGASWIGVGGRITDNSYGLDFSSIPGGATALIKVMVSDGFWSAEDVSDNPFAVANKPPTAAIVSPPAGASFPADTKVTLEGTGADLQDGSLGDAALTWSSDKDGALGSGQVLEVNLSPGTHTITLTARDSSGLTSTATITCNVVTPPPSLLANISTRAFVETGDNVMIGGFIITGSGPKKVILRAIGPSLVNFGITNPLQDPTLELHDQSTGAVIASNDNWMDAPNKQEIIDSGLAPTNNLESAILISLNPGAYTAIVRGVNNGTGIGLAEAFDLDWSAESKLGNISTRAIVHTGDNVMIGGLIIFGPDSKRVIVRAIGPSLAQYGIADPLADPTLELHDGNGAVIAFNDNWKDSQQAEIQVTGLAPANDLESAIVATLAPGNYTAIVRGVNNGTGVALVEVYGLN